MPLVPSTMTHDISPRPSEASRIRPYSARTNRSAAARPTGKRTRASLHRADVGNETPSTREGRNADRLSVGLDVTNVAEVASAVRRFGDRYVRRVFTPHEAAYCRAGSAAASR